MRKELLFKSYILLFEIEIALVNIIEHEMLTQYGGLWRQLFLLSVELTYMTISHYYSDSTPFKLSSLIMNYMTYVYWQILKML